ncbi:uncharacterized protein LOC130779843 isoform X2 [Actinidia eriantha]|uniref:uncharacterized protein LOC130779843 isoform X2 n=1 Tax=Actinidia eriantha TaxID=165200 RepID=UPI002582D11B|nr:uncharacterized protein LOC130779843 isoform X2 [Actinidia eriantha]
MSPARKSAKIRHRRRPRGGREHRETGSWKHMRITAPPGVSYYRRIFWKGAIHWMNRVNSHFRFDVDAENLVGTPLPSNPNTLPEDKICYLGECGGDLLLIQTRMYYAMKFRILEMDRDFSVLGVVKSANGEDVLVLAITGNFVLYNLNRKH